MATSTDWLSQARTLLEGLPDPAILLDARLAPVAFNACYAHASGLRNRQLRAALAGTAAAFEVLVHDPVADRETAREVLREGTVKRLAGVRVHNRSGTEFVMQLAFVPVKNGAGHPVALALVYRDDSAEARLQGRHREMLHREKARGDELERRVAERTAQLTQAMEELTRASTIDSLTGVLNRRSFENHARDALKMAQRYNRNVAVMMCDLDHFKRVNDTYGHPAGDAVLKAMASALSATVRETDRVARFGGEEFIVLLNETDPPAVLDVAERCADAVRSLNIPELIPGATFRQTVSIGVAIYPQHGLQLDGLLVHADTALYDAKEGGRDRVVLYSPKSDADRPANDQKPKPRVLLVVPDDVRAASYDDALAEQHEVVRCRIGLEALSLFTRQPFDVVVCDEDVMTESGVSLMRKTLPYLPTARRILVIEGEDGYTMLRATNEARVDHFVTRDESPEHLVAAIDETLRRARQATSRPGPLASETATVSAARLRGLQEILRGGQLDFAYQPIVRADDGGHFASEALCRPRHPAFSQPYPDPQGLFDLAAELGSLPRLGEVARETIVDDLRRHPQLGEVFINIHPGELKDRELFAGESQIREFAPHIVLELTERAAIGNPDEMARRIGELRKLGYRFAIDDLGDGYASLNSIALLRPDFVKIDHAMIADIARSEIRQRLVSSLASFAELEGIRVIAEGVETAADARIIADLGCHLQQGYFYGRPALLPDATRTDGKENAA